MLFNPCGLLPFPFRFCSRALLISRSLALSCSRYNHTTRLDNDDSNNGNDERCNIPVVTPNNH